MQLKIKLIDGDVSIHRITPAVEVAFEKHFKGGMQKLFREEERAEHIYWLAWECLRRSGQTVRPFEGGFLDQLDGIELVDDDPNG